MQIRSPVASTPPPSAFHRIVPAYCYVRQDLTPECMQCHAYNRQRQCRVWHRLLDFKDAKRENQNITLEQQLPHLISRAMESNWLQKHKIQHLKNEVERAIPNWLLFARNWYTRCIWLIFIISILSSFSTSQLCDIAQGRCCVFCDIISNYCLRAAERFWVFEVFSKKTFALNAGE